MAFHHVTCKLGNMRKEVEWTIYPVKSADEVEVIIQCDKRIAKVNLQLRKAVLSSGKGGHPGFVALQLGATVVDVPQDVIEAIKAEVKKMTGV